MSQENVEIVPAAFAPWTASEIDAFLKVWLRGP